MPKGRVCKICNKLKPEDIDFVNEHMQKGDMRYADMVNFLRQTYPTFQPWYNSNIQHHLEHATSLSSRELIQQATEKGKIIPDTVFAEREKIGSAESHEKLIYEYWINYLAIKAKPGQEIAKKGYLDSIARELETLSKSKVMEKDYLTQINILKEKREQDTPAQRLDIIEGWFIPTMLEKCRDNNEARGMIQHLMEFSYNLDLALGTGKDRMRVAKEGQDWLYDKNKGVI